MPNLPTNTEYNLGNSAAPKKPFSPASYSGTISAMQGYKPRVEAPGNYAKQLERLQSGEINPPIGQAIDRPVAGTKYSPIPEGYAGFVNPYKPKEAIETPAGAQIRSVPGVEGQYLIDKTDLGKPLKSARGYTREEKAMILGGLPSSLYQIDHIIPIWAEGADTLANKQVLTNEKHNDKTRAQAVTLTLLANGLIDKDQARLQAMKWQERDLTDVPMPSNETAGMIDLKVAKDIQARWDRQQEDPGYGTVLGVPWKNVKAEIGETLSVGGKGIIPEPLRQFGKGLVSGLTGGWLGGEPDASGFTGQAASLAGNIIGMIAPVGLFAKVLGVAGRTIAATRAGSKLIKPIDLARETKFYNAAKATEATKWNRPSFQNELIKNVRYDFGNVVKNTGALALYGQLSKDQFEMDTRTENFWTNVGYGVLSGAVPHSIKGAVKLAGGGAIMEAMMSEEVDPRQMTVNALAIGAMHALGAKGANARIEQKMKEIEPVLIAGQRNANSTLANNILHPYLPKDFPMLKEGEDPAAISQRYTVDELEQMANKALLKAAEERKVIPAEEADLNELRIKTAFKFLHNEKLPEAERDLAYLHDLVSLQKKANESSSFLHPESAIKTADMFTDDMMKKSFKYHEDANTPTLDRVTGEAKDFPVGRIQLTGQGKTEVDEVGALKYMEAKSKGEGFASPVVFSVLSPEREYAIRRANLAYTKEEIAKGEQKPSENPQNSMPVYAVIRDVKDGPKTIVRIGWVPRKFRVDEGIYAQNKSQFIKSKDNPNGFEPNDPMLNKDTFANAARSAEGNPNVVFFNLDNIGVAKGSKKPYVFVTANHETWRQSIDHAKKIGSAVETSSLHKNIQQVNSGIKGKELSENISAIKEKVDTPADMVLSNAPHADSPHYRDVTLEVISQAKAALTTNTPEELAQAFRNKVGIRLTPEETISIFERRGTLTTRDLFNVMRVANKENRLSPVSPFVYSHAVGPYLKSDAFQAWPLSKQFMDLRIIGGMKQAIGETPFTSKITPKTNAVEGAEAIRRQVETIDPKANAIVAKLAPFAVKGRQVAKKEPTKAQEDTSKITVEETNPNGQKTGDTKTISYRTSKSGEELIDITKNNPESPLADKDGNVWIETMSLKKAQEKYQTTDPVVLANRVVNAHDGYNYTTEKYVNPIMETINPETPAPKPQEPPQAPKEAEPVKAPAPVEKPAVKPQGAPQVPKEAELPTAAKKVEEVVKKAEFTKPRWREFAMVGKGKEGISLGASRYTDKPETLGQFTREKLTKVAKDVSNNGEDIAGGWPKYLATIEEKIQKANNDPSFRISDKKELRDLEWSFKRMANSSARNELTVSESGKPELAKGSLENMGQADKAIREYNKTNGLAEDAMDVIGISKGKTYVEDASKAYDSRNRFDSNVKALNNINGKKYVPVGITAKGEKNVVSVKFEPKLVEKFDANPSKYLNEGENLTTADDKFVRAFAVDVLGLPKDMTDRDFVKRANLIFHQYDQYSGDDAASKVKIHILKSKKIGGDTTVGPDDFIDPKHPGVKNTIDSFSSGAVIDGKFIVGEKLYKKLVEDFNYDPSKFKTGFKPLISGTVGENTKMIQKGHAIKADPALRAMLKEEYGLDLNENEIASFDTNAKVGPKEGTHEVSLGSIYAKPISVGGEGRIKASFERKLLSEDKQATADIIKQTEERKKDFEAFNKEILASKDYVELNNTIDKYADRYNLDKESLFFGTSGESFKLGAGKINLAHNLEKISKNLFTETVLSDVLPNSGRAFISPSFKMKLDGPDKPPRYVNDEEVILGSEFMKKHNLSEGDSVIVLRDPSYDINNVIVAKVKDGSKYGHESLGSEHAVVSPYNERLKLQGDQDGDTLLVVKVGEGGVPESYANAVTSRGKKAIPFTEVTPAPTGFVTATGIKTTIKDQLVGDDQTSRISIVNRAMDTIMDNDLTVKVYPAGSSNKSKYALLSKGKVVDSGETVASKDGFTAIPKWGNEEKQLRTQALQEALDSKKSKDIVSRTEDNNQSWMLKQVFIDAEGKKFNDFQTRSISGALTNIQKPFDIEKISAASKSLDDVFKELEPTFNMFHAIQAAGGKLTPLQEKLLNLSSVSTFKIPSKVLVEADKVGGAAVVSQLPAGNMKNPKLTAIRQLNDQAKMIRLSSKVSDADKKAAVKAVNDYFTSNLESGEYTAKDRYDLARWAATAKEANLSHGKKYIEKGKDPLFVYRYNNIINAHPKVAETYLKASETYGTEDTPISKFKTLGK